MSNRHGTSIKIFLPNGSTDGLWAVELSNWTGHALVAPRSSVAQLLERDEVAGPGVYVLIGPAESTAKSGRIYVGEADVLRTRLKQQQADKDFWTRLIVFTAGSASLNKARVKYIESRLVELAIASGRMEVENAAAPKRPSLSEADTAEVEGFVDEMLVIYPVLGLTAFETLLDERSLDGDSTVFWLKGAETEASGRETSDGFVVFEGSKGRATHVPSIHEYGIALRESLKADGTFILKEGKLILARDYVFSSPSTAAMVFLGRTANGRIEWKISDGVPLKEHQDVTSA